MRNRCGGRLPAPAEDGPWDPAVELVVSKIVKVLLHVCCKNEHCLLLEEHDETCKVCKVLYHALACMLIGSQPTISQKKFWSYWVKSCTLRALPGPPTPHVCSIYKGLLNPQGLSWWPVEGSWFWSVCISSGCKIPWLTDSTRPSSEAYCSATPSLRSTSRTNSASPRTTSGIFASHFRLRAWLPSWARTVQGPRMTLIPSFSTSSFFVARALSLSLMGPLWCCGPSQSQNEYTTTRKPSITLRHLISVISPCIYFLPPAHPLNLSNHPKR